MNSSAVRVHSFMSVNPAVDYGTFHLDVRFKSHSLALVATSASEWRFPIRLMRMARPPPVACTIATGGGRASENGLPAGSYRAQIGFRAFSRSESPMVAVGFQPTDLTRKQSASRSDA